MKPSDTRLEDIARWLAITLTADQRALIIRYERWLLEEAIPSGGMGPNERHRLWDRHIVDSLAFLIGFPANAQDLVDVGGGIGLPSIPLAIARPDIMCFLVDRSERRTSLAKRALRILAIDNLEIQTRDVDAVTETRDVVTFRASLRIPIAAATSQRLVSADGVGLFAVSRQVTRPVIPSPPDGISFAMTSEGDGVLDSPFWLLRMRHS